MRTKTKFWRKLWRKQGRVEGMQNIVKEKLKNTTQAWVHRAWVCSLAMLIIRVSKIMKILVPSGTNNKDK